MIFMQNMVSSTNEMRIIFDETKLNGLKTYAYGFTSDDLESGINERFNYWNFTNNRMWDSITTESFWYNVNTSIIYKTVPFVIGQT